MDQLNLSCEQHTHKWQNQCFILYWKMFNDRNKHAQMTHPVLKCCLALHKYSSMMDLHKCIAIVSSPDPTSRGSGNETGIAKSCKCANIKLMYQRYVSSGISRKGHSPARILIFTSIIHCALECFTSTVKNSTASTKQTLHKLSYFPSWNWTIWS